MMCTVCLDSFRARLCLSNWHPCYCVTYLYRNTILTVLHVGFCVVLCAYGLRWLIASLSLEWCMHVLYHSSTWKNAWRDVFAKGGQFALVLGILYFLILNYQLHSCVFSVLVFLGWLCKYLFLEGKSVGNDPPVSLPHDSHLPHVVGVYFQLEFCGRKSGTSPFYCFILWIICCHINT